MVSQASDRDRTLEHLTRCMAHQQEYWDATDRYEVLRRGGLLNFDITRDSGDRLEMDPDWAPPPGSWSDL